VADLNLIPLFTAAALAYQQVFGTRRTEGISPSADELDLVALVLSARLPVYGVRAPEAAPARIPERELMRGMFWGGAMRFESGDERADVIQLVVGKSDLERVLEQLKRNPLEL
jgi:hypothetical protein